MQFHLVSLFPEVCQAYLEAGVLGRAQKTDKGKGAKVRGKKIEVSYYNPRSFSVDKHRKVDERPYGGGPGMVMLALPILKAWEKAVGRKTKSLKEGKVKTLIMSPRGTLFTQELAKEYADKFDHLVLISGRYEGIDDRVRQILDAEEVSVGDYILTGGELPALTIIDATSRQIPGVLGTFESLEEKRPTRGEVYTRPEIFEYKRKKYVVPKVLIDGNHKEIDKWRQGNK
jgi:tRNA (guanine37-N1)-methyltransferase